MDDGPAAFPAFFGIWNLAFGIYGKKAIASQQAPTAEAGFP